MSIPSRRIAATMVEMGSRVDQITDHLQREGGKVVNVASEAAGRVMIRHTLGRKPKYWVVLDKDANADVWRDPADHWTSEVIYLRVSGAVHAKVRLC